MRFGFGVNALRVAEGSDDEARGAEKRIVFFAHGRASSGTLRCAVRGQWYTAAILSFNTWTGAVYVGDNEWTDCHCVRATRSAWPTSDDESHVEIDSDASR